VLSFKHSYAVKWNDILHADGGVVLYPAALTGFLAAGLNFHSRVPCSCDKERGSKVASRKYHCLYC
jgi:hypothetical protein